jgi:hypothetical protein
MNAENLKYLSLLTLTVQNSAVSLSMRYAKTRPGDIFFSSTGKSNPKFEIIPRLNDYFRCSCVHGGNDETLSLFGARLYGGRNFSPLQSKLAQCHHKKQNRHSKKCHDLPPNFSSNSSLSAQNDCSIVDLCSSEQLALCVCHQPRRCHISSDISAQDFDHCE